MATVTQKEKKKKLTRAIAYCRFYTILSYLVERSIGQYIGSKRTDILIVVVIDLCCGRKIGGIEILPQMPQLLQSDTDSEFVASERNHYDKNSEALFKVHKIF